MLFRISAFAQNILMRNINFLASGTTFTQQNKSLLIELPCLILTVLVLLSTEILFKVYLGQRCTTPSFQNFIFVNMQKYQFKNSDTT